VTGRCEIGPDMEAAMADELEIDPTEPEGVTPEGEGGPAGDKRAVLADLAKERDKRQELERRLEELEPLAKKAKEIEDAQKTELQRANERLAELEAKASRAETEALRYRIATKHGLSDEDAEIFLTGSDEESIAKQAERLVALQGERVVAQQQKPDPSQGARPGAVKNPKEAGKARARARFGDPGK
jgi:hypothetical protein